MCVHSDTWTALIEHQTRWTAWDKSSTLEGDCLGFLGFFWATIPPFAMMYIRPVDLQTGKRRHALFVRLVVFEGE